MRADHKIGEDMPITHIKVSAKSDSPDPSIIQPSDWNDEHVVDIFSDSETPIGVIDSTNGSDGNDTFTLSYTPNPATSLLLVVFGVVYLINEDYFLIGNEIRYRLGRVPRIGQWHRAWYRRA